MPLTIEYYTDILCVWAWIAQRRLDELENNLSGEIDIHYVYTDIFGDVPTKMNTQWQSKGGYEGFALHVQESASTFDHAPVNPQLWINVKPITSANAHLVLKAIEIAYGKETGIAMALIFREAFFKEALDIGNLEILNKLMEESNLDVLIVQARMNDGSAMAALMKDYQKSKQQNIKGSPSYVIDGGRQTLYGNVGYRVLHANVEELLKKPSDEASWC